MASNVSLLQFLALWCNGNPREFQSPIERSKLSRVTNRNGKGKMSELSSKRVYKEVQEYYSISIPATSTVEEIADAEAELKVFLKDYYGTEETQQPLISEIRKGQKIILRFPTMYQMVGTDLNPLVFDDIVDARSLMK